MAENERRKIQLYRTYQLGTVASNIEIGEVALNYNPNSPFIMFKDSNDSIQKLGAMRGTSGTSEYFTMTQKSISDYLATEKNNRIAQDNKIEASVGLAEDGSYIKRNNSNYINDANTIVEAIDNLDKKAKEHSDSIEAIEDFIGMNPEDGSSPKPVAEQITDAINSLDATVTDSSTNVTVQTIQTNGKLSSILVSQTDIASANALNAEVAARKSVEGQTGQTYTQNTNAKIISGAVSLNNADVLLNNALVAEIAARKAVDGQSGQIYSANGGYKYLSGATSLNDADIKLNNAITAETKARQDAINALDNVVTSSTTNVSVTIAQENGLLRVVELAQTDIASASALTAEIAARKAVDGQSGQTYAVNTSAKHISGATSLNDADIKLNNAITAETKARQDAINALDATKSGSTTHVNVTVAQLNGLITGVTVGETDIASASALTAEIAARKAVDGQSGQTYAANTSAKYISAATSLNNADVLLNNAITAETKARQDAINALDATLTDSTTNIDIEVVQLNGKLTGLTLTQTDIASASALTAEIAARKAVDGQSGQTYAKNAGATYISAATSLNNADVLLSNAISNLKLTAVTGTELDGLGTNVREAYKLIDVNSTKHGDYIKIYKDTSLKTVTFSDQKLHFTYILTDGSEKVVDVDVSNFLAESEYSDGLQVIDHIISVKRDATSESFLSVSSDGVKLSGVQNAINSAINALDATVSGNGTHVDVTVTQTNGKITNVAVAESDIASASALTAEIAARKAVDGQSGQTYAKNTSATHISAATSLNDADIKLNNAITAETSNRATAITNAINALDATVSGNGAHVDVTVTQTNGKITNVAVAESDIASASALSALNSWCAYMSGHTTATSLTSVPTTKRMCVATISSSQTLGISGSVADGREVHIFVKNTSTSDITITIPSTIGGKTCINMVGENLIIYGSSYGEINLAYDGSTYYYRGA